MIRKTAAMALVFASVTSAASAQVAGVDLNGPWRCVAGCAAGIGTSAFVTQYGWQMNIAIDTGFATRAFVNYPGRLWVERAWQGAVYSADGRTIQFDSGMIWARPGDRPRRRR